MMAGYFANVKASTHALAKVYKRPASKTRPVKKTVKKQPSTMTGPATRAQTFLWATQFLQLAIDACGTQAVIDGMTKLGLFSIAAAFSGIGCGERCVVGLLAAARKRYGKPFSEGSQIFRAIEWDEDCKWQLSSLNPNQHIFENITDIYNNLERAPQTAYCWAHETQRRLRASSAAPRLEIAGPPCVMHSRMGQRKAKQDPRYVTHESWINSIKRELPQVVIFENVNGYNRPNLDVLQDRYDIQWACLNPIKNGFPVNRPRVYAVCLRRGQVKWQSSKPLQDHVDIYTRSSTT